MATRRQIEDALHAWFVAATGYDAAQVIWANQSAVPPELPYATLQIIAGPTSIGIFDDLSTPPRGSPSAEVILSGVREQTLSCRLFGDGASDKAELVNSALSEPIPSSNLQAAQIVTFTLNRGEYYAAHLVTLGGVEIVVPAVLSLITSVTRALLVEKINANRWCKENNLHAAKVAGHGNHHEFTVTSRRGCEFSFSAGATMTAALTQAATDISLIDTPAGVVDLGVQRETDFEDAANIDVRFYISKHRVVVGVSTIESVEIGAKLFTDAAGTRHANKFTSVVAPKTE
jgi:hypothetical protein